MASASSSGYELPLLLFGGFRAIIEELHAELAQRGHPEMRPAHGFAMQAIGLDGATATDVGRRLGISKQAAGKTIEQLEAVGYATRTGDDADRRRKLVRLTPRGIDALGQSALIFSDIRDRWVAALGPGHVDDLEASLRQMADATSFRLDAAAWLGAG
ncbi:MAG TPA: MarR family winged helix-turn-helix transcriptional regulator [Trebonia sp.]|nr:MarR family winged helix-turn-helix transcriptional regulator [Trebonia sp.]